MLTTLDIRSSCAFRMRNILEYTSTDIEKALFCYMNEDKPFFVDTPDWSLTPYPNFDFVMGPVDVSRKFTFAFDDLSLTEYCM